MKKRGNSSVSERSGDTQRRSTAPRRSSARSQQSQQSCGSDEGQLEVKRQELFLIEFLVGRVCLDEEVIPPDLLEQQTCLTFRFLHFAPMDLCEKDFLPNKELLGASSCFNSGKSLMFALAEKYLSNPPPICLEFNVFKSPPKREREEGEEEGDEEEEEEEQERVIVGSVKICLSELFKEIFEDINDNSKNKTNLSRAIKGCYELVTKGRKTTGTIEIFVRLSNLGQNVVTSFQCGNSIREDPVLFKNTEGKSVWEFQTKEPEQPIPPEFVGYDCGCGGTGAMPPGSPGGYHPNQNQQYAGDWSQNQQSYPEESSERKKEKEKKGKKKGRKGEKTNPNEIIFDCPPKKDMCRGDHNVLTYNVTRNEDKFEVTPESMYDPCRTKDGLTDAQKCTDPTKNIFVMNVGGDPGTSISTKSRMQLELVTPKQVIERYVLPPYHEDVAVQTGKDKDKKKKKKK